MRFQKLILTLLIICIGVGTHVAASAPESVVSADPAYGINIATVLNVSINGSGFEDNPTLGVKLIKGSSEIFATNVSFISNSTITCDLPINGSEIGLWDVLVTNDGTNYKVDTAVFHIVNPAPESVDTADPPFGVNNATVPYVLITGSGFGNTQTLGVRLIKDSSEIFATNVSFVSDTTVTCDLPINRSEIGLWDVQVTNDGSNYKGNTATFNIVYPTPTIISITPSSGVNTTNSTGYLIQGTDFVDGATVKLSTFPVFGRAASENEITAENITFINSSVLMCDLPIKGASPGIWDVMVTNPGNGDETGVLPGGFIINGPPALVIHTITPNSGTNMETVQVAINGTNFTRIASAELFNQSFSIPGTIISQTNTSVQCSFRLIGAPNMNYTLTLFKTDGGLGSLENAFTITNASPIITGINPAYGYNNTNISTNISGANFRSNLSVTLTNGTTVLDGSIVSRNYSAISCTFPINGSKAGLYNITVRNIDGTSTVKPGAFTIREALIPNITNFTPTDVINSSQYYVMRINGSNFEKGATIFVSDGVNRINARTATVTSTQILAAIQFKDAPLGIYNLTVQNPYGTFGSAPGTLRVTSKAPILQTILPGSAYNTSICTAIVSYYDLYNGAQIFLVNGSSNTTINGVMTENNYVFAYFNFNLTGKPAGIYNLTAINVGSLPTTLVNCFTVLGHQSVPTIANFSPQSGSSISTTQFSVNGTSFRTGATIILRNGTTSFTTATTYINSNKVSCTLPLTGKPLGLYNVTVVNADGTANTSEDLFEIVNPIPTITTVLPVSAYNTIPVSVAISGSNFVSGLQVELINNTITIPGIVSGWSKTKFTGTFNLTGQPAGLYNLKVTNPGGPNTTKTNAFTVKSSSPYPTITDFSPMTGTNISTLQFYINGADFRTGMTVTISNKTTTKTATGVVMNETRYKCILPLVGVPLGQYTVTVRNTDGTENTSASTLAIINPTPGIVSLTPLSAFNTSPITITITGTNFVSGLEVSLVNSSTIIPGVVSKSTRNQIIATFNLTRQTASQYNLTVINPGGPNTTKGNAFTVLAPDPSPAIVNFFPISGPNTQTVPIVVNGTNFRKGATVKISNGTQNTTVGGTLNGNTQIRASLPLTGLPLRDYNLTVINTDGSQCTSNDSFKVTNPTPVITTALPASAYNTTPVEMTISGSDFIVGLNISLVNGSRMIIGTVTGWSKTQFIGTFPIPGNLSGYYNLTVTNPGRIQAKKVNAINILPPKTDPEIVNFSPAYGVNNAALPFTVYGSNYRTGLTVTIRNGTTNKTVTGIVTGGNKVTCSLPLTGLPIGLYNVSVKNIDGSTNESGDLFLVKYPNPTITGISPITAMNTSSVAITVNGGNFISGLNATLTNGSTTITGSISGLTATKFVGTFALPGNQAGIYNLTVINPGGPNSTKPNAFTVTAQGSIPTITNFNPISGRNTATLPLTINGSGFRTGIKATITNGTNTRTVSGSIINQNKITCSFQLSGMPFGLYNVTVVNTDGTNCTSTDKLTVISVDPVITVVAPTSSFNTSNKQLTIIGNNFVQNPPYPPQVFLSNGSYRITGSIVSGTATLLYASFPLIGKQAGLYNLTVTTAWGISTTKVNIFRIDTPGPAPMISAINPASGLNNASLPVTITGVGFKAPKVFLSQGSTQVEVPATAGKTSTSSTLYVTLPLTGRAGGWYNITVTNNDGAVGTATNIFYLTDLSRMGPNRPTVQTNVHVTGVQNPANLNSGIVNPLSGTANGGGLIAPRVKI